MNTDKNMNSHRSKSISPKTIKSNKVMKPL
jgi:hypothetical protein